MAWVNLAGVGEVPDHFSIGSDGVNLEMVKWGNHHNENQVGVACNRGDWFNDDFNVTGQKLADGRYKLSIDMDSEVPIGVFSRGRVDLLYNPHTRHWSMTSWVNKGKVEWRFCDAIATIDIVLGGLDCLKAAPEAKPYAQSLGRFTESIKREKSAVAASAPQYADRADCTSAITSSASECESAWCIPPGAPGL